MKAVVLGYHNFGYAGVEALLRNGFEVAAVFTHRDDPAETIWFRSVAELAASNNIPVFAPDDINHPLWAERIAALKPDVLFSFFYRKLIKQPILDIPAAGCLNLHASLLPRYRGRCPINWALVNGECETGVTLHYMTAKPDEGDIVGQNKVAISESDTALSLSERLCTAAAALLDETLPRIANRTAARVHQDPAMATYFGGRRPRDGEIDWSRSAREVRNLIRAVTRPYPGAFSHFLSKKCLIWTATETRTDASSAAAGTVVSVDPLEIACERGALRIDLAQPEGGVPVNGSQLAVDLHIHKGTRLGKPEAIGAASARPTRVLILGANGFIGNALTQRLLRDRGYDVFGMDLCSDHIEHLLGKPGFHFSKGDISIHREWLEYHVKTCDVVLPLVAIATPIEYVRNPIRVFELDFEENLRVIRYCVKYKKRVVFPSTSEVYGMCEEEEFDEDNSRLVQGPIRMQRWIYSCCKQLLDRVIWAYGSTEGLQFTLFRPFNWIGPKLDSLTSARIGSSRVITQLILNLVEGRPIQLIDGGHQKRCFTDVADGIECLARIIENAGGVCDGRIINIGNPANEASIRELAGMLVVKFDQHPFRSLFPPFAGFEEIESAAYYGSGYQDLKHRRPSIKNARKLVNWEPRIGLEKSVESTLEFFIREYLDAQEWFQGGAKAASAAKVAPEGRKATRGIVETAP